MRSNALAVCPGSSVTSEAGATVDRVAAAPTWTGGEPAVSDTPGYPNSVHAVDEMFVKSMTW